MILVSKVAHANNLIRLLIECTFSSTYVHGEMRQEVCIHKYKSFKDSNARILVLTDLFERGIDIERVNVAVNYDLPHDLDQFLHGVGYTGRVWNKGYCYVFHF